MPNPVENDLSVLLNKDFTGNLNAPDDGWILIYFQGNISNIMFAVCEPAVKTVIDITSVGMMHTLRILQQSICSGLA